jgi:hypothetical protein
VLSVDFWADSLADPEILGIELSIDAPPESIYVVPLDRVMAFTMRIT